MNTERTRPGDSCGLNTLRAFRQRRTTKRELNVWRRRASHDLFGRTANASWQGKETSRLSSAWRSLFRGACGIALAVLDAYLIVGQIPHAPPNLHEFARNDPNREEASVRSPEDRARK
jgi:hypothetical protein